ncbi:PPC domain-containing protein [Allohahella sp. A8]|uniref:PPC domain-containing protein n=1 Tax=Allohahella sp. A8 TaxID=3141461 RepID=UPI003A7FB7CE
MKAAIQQYAGRAFEQFNQRREAPMCPRKPLFLTTLLVSAIMLSACGGGSGGDKKPREDGDSAKPPITGGNTGGGSKGPGGGTTEDNKFMGPSGEFRNMDQEPNNDETSIADIGELTNLKGQVNSQNDSLDVYSFKVPQTGSYRLTLTGFEGNDLDLLIADDLAEDSIAVGENDAGQDEVIDIELTANKEYFLAVRGYDTAGQTSDYRLIAEKRGSSGGGSESGGSGGGGSGGNSGISESEPNDQASQSNEIRPNTEVNGAVNATEDPVDYYQIELPAGDNLIMLYDLNGASVNFDITAGPGGPVIASGQAMTNPEGFRRTLALDQATRWGLRVVATDTNGRDQPYTLSVVTQ